MINVYLFGAATRKWCRIRITPAKGTGTPAMDRILCGEGGSYKNVSWIPLQNSQIGHRVHAAKTKRDEPNGFAVRCGHGVSGPIQAMYPVLSLIWFPKVILYPIWYCLDASSLVGPQISHPRLAISTVLLGDHINGFVSHFGLKCSSFSPVNAGTSGRTPCTPYGNFHYTSVLEGNCLASRKLGVFKLKPLFMHPIVYVSQSSKCLVVSRNIKTCSCPWLANFSNA